MGRLVALTGALAAAVAVASPCPAGQIPAPAFSPASTTWAVSIVLPERIEAGRPATLAVLGVDGRLAPYTKVELDDGQTLTTDSTGRAFFTAPAGREFLIAKGSGASAAALIDPARVADTRSPSVSLPGVISAHDRFWICGAGLRGDSDANHVTINGQLALVLAASPSCLTVVPGPYVGAGLSVVSVDAPGGHWSAPTTVVFLEFDKPNPPLRPGKKGRMEVRVRGSEEKLALTIENRSPGVIEFTRGDARDVETSGGENNVASFPVRVIRSGDFSFRARLIAAAQPEIAARYLKCAAGLAPKDLQKDVSNLSERLSARPRDAAAVAADLDALIVKTITGDFRTVLEAARASL